MLGASIGLRLSPQWNAFVGYDAEIRGKDVANLVSGGIKSLGKSVKFKVSSCPLLAQKRTHQSNTAHPKTWLREERWTDEP
jgi:hypothetical protein